MKKGIILILIFIFVPIVFIGIGYVIIRAYNKKHPGLRFKFKCDQEGDDTSKFFGDNWEARGAVCDGLYIPYGVKLNGKDYIKVLAKMGKISNGVVPSKKSEMKTLAKTSVEQTA